MGTLKMKLQVISLMFLFAFASVQIANASAKAGEASVVEGYTASISLADVYVRTLKKSTNITYRWYSENNSYVKVTSFTRDRATIKGIKATSSCRVYFYCSYFIDGFFRTMDFYYTVTVKPDNVSVTGISLSQSSASLNIGETVQLIANISPSTASNKSVRWTSDNTSAAMVSSNGLVTAKSAGNATITCRANDGSGKFAKCAIVCRETVPQLVISDKDGLTDIPPVANVQYERQFYKGWNSVCLPFAFDVKLLGLQGAKIVLLCDWKTVGNRKYIFYQDVEYADAGSPCLVYLPFDQKCKIILEKVPLVDRPIKNGLLQGSFTKKTIGSGCYKLTSDGKSFAATKTESAVCKPFRVYFKK